MPGQDSDVGRRRPAATSYVGNGGVGDDTAAKPLRPWRPFAGELGLAVGGVGPAFADRLTPGAGVFRYDVPTADDDILDGLSQTILIAETAESNGPWLRGGPATVRSLAPERTRYVGVGGAFGGCHRGGGQFAFCDGSARFLSDTIDPAVLRALLTIADGEGHEPPTDT